MITVEIYGLLPLLQRLDALLEQATAPEAEAIERAEIPAAVIPAGSRIAWLQYTFGLSDFDLDLLTLALAPELDRRYDHLYAYLQNDTHCTRPTVDLALRLFSATIADKLSDRCYFATDAPLIHQEILHLISNQTRSTLLTQELHLDEQIIRFLLHQPGLDSQLKPFCHWVDLTLPAAPLHLGSDLHSPLRLYFQGSDHPSKLQTARALAKAIDAPLLKAELPRLVHAKVEAEPALKRLFREAVLEAAVLYLEGVEVLYEQPTVYGFLLQALAAHQGMTILTGELGWRSEISEPLGVVTVAFPLPDFNQRRKGWEHYLKQSEISIEEKDLNALAARFRLTETQIADAIMTVIQQAKWNDRSFALLDLFAAARAQAGQRLDGLAKKIEPSYSWEDIVLPSAQLVQLRELCNQAKYRQVVFEDWGFGRLSLGKGLNALFSGLPGTGKTMGAEVIAQDLQLDLYKIDLSQIVSKYIGETEKNLDRIFTIAANSNAILLFDEADALFGKRSEVQDAHDRYANIEIGYLLQKMEEYEGIAILTTNLRSSLDDAFVRRLQFMIDFPLPQERDRLEIWQRVLPPQTPRSEDVDLGAIARRFELSGAHIRNIALAAAFLAASEAGIVTMNHLIRATQREYQKMGKLWVEGDRGG